VAIVERRCIGKVGQGRVNGERKMCCSPLFSECGWEGNILWLITA
jgi:hypothetical protein